MSRRYLLDTGIAQDLIYRRREIDLKVNDYCMKGFVVGICTPVLGELYSGVECSRDPDLQREILNRRLRLLRIWPYNNEVAQEFGRIFSRLRQIGRPIQQVDIQIAAIVLTLGDCTLVTSDSDFSAVPGLPIESW